MRRFVLTSAVGAAILAAGAVPAARQQAAVLSHAEGCRDAGNSRNLERHCEVRELTFSAPRVLEIRDVANGSVSVTGGSRSDVRLRARIVAWAPTADEARQLAGSITVEQGNGRVTADGPRSERNRNWSVSFRAEVPAAQEVDLSSTNGAVAIANLRSRVRGSTTNGSVRLTETMGDVDVSTTNGSVVVQVSGSTWEGAGLRASSSNGSVHLDVPASFNARLRAATSNGSISTAFPIAVQGRLREDVDVVLGSGGPTLDLRTSNGSIRIGSRR